MAKQLLTLKKQQLDPGVDNWNQGVYIPFREVKVPDGVPVVISNVSHKITNNFENLKNYDRLVFEAGSSVVDGNDNKIYINWLRSASNPAGALALTLDISFELEIDLSKLAIITS
ncbi:MAG: hypothetical protein E6Q53_00500 [Candidatus Moraniibacteriota bacterium]|nr:MAG: hypothetical protein E6Q53_00500 [Candidatus Moranbacteria bacterium]